MRPALFAILCVFAMNTAYSHESSTQESHRYIVIPSDQGLVLILPQPDCPLEFEDIKLLADARGLWIPAFRLRNQGKKPIRAVTVAAPGNGEWGWQAADSLHYVMPGEIVPLGEDNNDEIVPLTEALREKLKLKGPMKGVLVLVVVQVEFADGLTFHEGAYNSLKEYFEKLYLGNRTEKAFTH